MCSLSMGRTPGYWPGGTDLLIELRRGSKKAPRVVLDISGVAELAGIADSNGSITIGPLATHAELVRSEVVHKFAPLLSVAAATIGSPQIRARATVGGNIMNAAACADTVPPLMALGANVTLQSKAGSRELALADLFVKPYETKARADELLTAVRFPKLGPGARSAFIKLGRRNALAISRLSVAAILEVGKDGRIAEARIVPGAAFPTWQTGDGSGADAGWGEAGPEAVRCRREEGLRRDDQGHRPALVHGV